MMQGVPRATPDIAADVGASVLIDGEPATVYDIPSGHSKLSGSKTAAGTRLLDGENEWFIGIQQVRSACFLIAEVPTNHSSGTFSELG
jgi:hypothetical protein